VYWQVIHGNTPEEMARDEEGGQIMEIQGRNMAWLIKPWPPAGKKQLFRFSRREKERTS